MAQLSDVVYSYVPLRPLSQAFVWRTLLLVPRICCALESNVLSSLQRGLFALLGCREILRGRVRLRSRSFPLLREPCVACSVSHACLGLVIVSST